MIGITLAVYNKLEYTKLCLESLHNNLPPQSHVVVVDNASSDGTAHYLSSLQWLSVIFNKENLGCAPAWNQGVQKVDGEEWTVILNNDIILTEGWWSGLMLAAECHKLDIVSPAIREGELNYEISSYAREFTSSMANVIRNDTAHAVCFAVRRNVFNTIGNFDENFKIGQYEDTDFFRRARIAGFRLGSTGGAFVHHFGSVTQQALKKRVPGYALENKAYFVRKWKLSWWQRALERNRDKLFNRFSCFHERLRFGHSLVEKMIQGKLRYY